ncbi:response regulator [Enterobacter asburiae]|uniref:response regulator n=1 Tax=Enterobacter TaxID=547 RepID=UPI000513FBB7|nr:MULTISPECIES: response regulator [Enterobacter]KGI63994.1 response regulator [Enterobacter sp. UCD-UG_FMILLET]MCK7285409.1 response regulator [Enterobacter asburiae]
MEKYIYFLSSKNISILLTDDFYFFYGLKKITGLPLVHMTYDGTTHPPAIIRGKGKIRVLIDGRIFKEGNWRGFNKLRESLKKGADWIWLDVSGHGRFYPEDCEYHIYANLRGSMHDSIMSLYHAYLRRRITMIYHHYPRLTVKELDILQSLLDNDSIAEIQKKFCLGEKTATCYRSRIVQKFGCRGYGMFMQYYERNKEIIDRKWRYECKQ